MGYRTHYIVPVSRKEGMALCNGQVLPVVSDRSSQSEADVTCQTCKQVLSKQRRVQNDMIEEFALFVRGRVR